MIEFEKFVEQYMKKMKVPYNLDVQVHVFYVDEPKSSSFHLDLHDYKVKILFNWDTTKDVVQNVYNFSLVLGSCILAIKKVSIDFSTFEPNNYKIKMGKYWVFNLKKYYESVSKISHTQ
ncbi:MAG: hypothetical protein QW156_03850 [Candidatus Aenigmatarchaeota archaeon]